MRIGIDHIIIIIIISRSSTLASLVEAAEEVVGVIITRQRLQAKRKVQIVCHKGLPNGNKGERDANKTHDEHVEFFMWVHNT